MRCLYAAVVVAALVPLTAARADDTTPPVVGGQTWVQHQIVAAKAAHPEIAAITVIGQRPGDKAPVLFGSTASAAAVFTPAPAGSDAVGTTRAGGHVVVREPFLNSSNHRLGTIAVTFADKAGDEAKEQTVARAVQAKLARSTLSAKNAADPYPFDPKFGPGTYAQTLTEKTVAAHPDLLVMMIHATPPQGGKNVIIGSNIGRFGKAADDDDLRVIDKGETNLEVGDGNDRFETELPLNDASGKRIGALGLVFPYKPSDDKEAIHRHGLAIRDELARSIPTSAALFKPAR